MSTRNRVRPIFMSTLTSRVRDVAAGAVPRRGLGALPRPRLRGGGRAGALSRPHAGRDSAAALIDVRDHPPDFCSPPFV